MLHRARLLAFAAAGGGYALVAHSGWHGSAPVRHAAAIVLATLVLWISEVAPLGIVALGIPIAATFTGVLTWRDAIAVWGDPVVFLFLGAFLLARALDKHGAFAWVASARWLHRAGGASGVGLALAVLAISGLISTVQNNTAVTAMLLPVVITLARRTSAPAIVLLALAWGATFGGVATPVGTAPNFIGFAAMKKLDASVNFLSWLRVGVPAWLGATLIGWGVLAAARRVRYADRSVSADSTTAGPKWLDEFVAADVGPERGAALNSAAAYPAARRWALAALAVAAALWLVPGIIIGLTPESHRAHTWVKTYLPESLVPLGVAWLLFMIRAGPQRRPILDRHDFAALDWDTLFLIAGGLCLGRVLETSGAATALAEAVTGANLPPRLLVFALAGATVLLSELTSNTATASLMVPIAGSLAPALGLSPVHSIWLVALAASLGFILPVSTPPNALVYGTRLVPLRVMAATGVFVDVLCTIWIVCCVLWFA